MPVEKNRFYLAGLRPNLPFLSGIQHRPLRRRATYLLALHFLVVWPMVRLLYVLWLAQPLIWAYALWPIGMLKLVLVAMVYHRLWGKTYPLKTPSPQPALPSTAQHLPGMDLSTTDLQGLLARFDQSNNLTPDELGQLVLAAEEQAIARRFGSVSCGQVMTAQLWTSAPEASLDSLVAQFQQHSIKSLPVVDANWRLLGVVARGTLLDWTGLGVAAAPTAAHLASVGQKACTTNGLRRRLDARCAVVRARQHAGVCFAGSAGTAGIAVRGSAARRQAGGVDYAHRHHAFAAVFIVSAPSVSGASSDLTDRRSVEEAGHLYGLGCCGILTRSTSSANK